MSSSEPQQGGGGGTVIEPGASFGDLRLVREIGRGAQGVVFEAQQVSIGRRVAVKILSRAVTFTDEQVERFRREAEAAGRLNHANIVAVHERFESGGHEFIVQELVEGTNLEDVLDDRREEETRTDVDHCRWAATICRQLADGLAHAHAAGVIHRDIKPANVLISAEGVPKLTDFGLAKVEDEAGLSRTGALMGTPHYMSPEQVAASPVDVRTDVYSLGAVLYELLTLRVPFSGDAVQGIFVDILTRVPRPPRKQQPGVSADLEAVCLKALEKAPVERYPSAGEFGDDLQRFLDGQSTVARPVGPIGRSIRSMRRLATSTLAVVSLLVATAWFAADLLLQPLAEADLDLHAWRMTSAVAAALLASWPLSLLGLRLARGRASGRVAGALLAAVVGLLAVTTIRADWVRGRIDADSFAIRSILEQELQRERSDADEIDAFVDRWGDEFEPGDRMLAAQAYLHRSRPVRARGLLEGVTEEHVPGAPYWALRTRLEHELGDQTASFRAEERMYAEARAGEDWRDWLLVGDVLAGMGRLLDARAAYETAHGCERPDRDVIDIRLARVLRDLCLGKEAEQALGNFKRYRPTDLRGLLLSFDIALADVGAGPEEAAFAERLLTKIESHPDTRRTVALASRYGLQRHLAPDDAAEFLRFQADVHAEDPAVQDWVARQALTLERTAAEDRAREAQAAGDTDAAAAATAEALEWLEFSERAYGRLVQQPGDSYVGRVGRAAARIRLHYYDPADRRVARLDAAIEDARRALELEADHWEAWFNLGLALRHRARRVHGDEHAIPADEVAEYAAAMREAARLNDDNVNALNDTAHAYALILEREERPGLREEGLALVERAARSLVPPEGSACAPHPRDRFFLSACHDTARELHETGGDLAAARDAARRALEALEPGDPRHELRRETLQRLDAALGGSATPGG